MRFDINPCLGWGTCPAIQMSATSLAWAQLQLEFLERIPGQTKNTKIVGSEQQPNMSASNEQFYLRY